MVILNKFLKNHKSIKNEFDPFNQRKVYKNTELLCKLNNLQKWIVIFLMKLKIQILKMNKCIKIKILGDLIINK